MSIWYTFECPSCKEKMWVYMGQGRYGNLGSSKCAYYNEAYYATNDDYIVSNLYVHNEGKAADALGVITISESDDE